MRNFLHLFICVFLMNTSLFSQNYEDIFKNNQSQNLSVFIKNGFTPEKNVNGIYTNEVTYKLEKIENDILYFIRYSIKYGADNLPAFIVITSNSIEAYEIMLKHCTESGMKRYYDESDLSSKFDICYTNEKYAYGFKSNFYDKLTVYSITIIK